MLRLTARYADVNADRLNDVAAVHALNARIDAACHDDDPGSICSTTPGNRCNRGSGNGAVGPLSGTAEEL